MVEGKRPNRNRTKGHDAERYYAQLFRSYGFDKCITTREGSRLLDGCGIDLLNLPFLVQIKAGKQTAMNPSEVLQYMKERIALELPENAPEVSMPKIVIHKKDIGRGKKETPYHQLVYMSMDDFIKLMNFKKVEEDENGI